MASYLYCLKCSLTSYLSHLGDDMIRGHELIQTQ